MQRRHPPAHGSAVAGRLPELRQPVLPEPAVLVQRQSHRVDVPARDQRSAGRVRAHVLRAGRVGVAVAVAAGVLEARPVHAPRHEGLAAAAVNQVVAHHFSRGPAAAETGSADASDRHDQSRRDPSLRARLRPARVSQMQHGRIVPRLDHIGLDVSDYDRSKAFYEQALAPLGMKLMMEPVPTWGIRRRVPLLLDRPARTRAGQRRARGVHGRGPRDRRCLPRRRARSRRDRQRRAGRARDLPPALLRRVRARPRRQQRRGRLPHPVGSHLAEVLLGQGLGARASHASTTTSSRSPRPISPAGRAPPGSRRSAAS